jgi:uncharacterized protein YndB with AHSA1/START domain
VKRSNAVNPPAGVTNAADPGREVIIRRVLNAPRELVFQVWTDPVHLSRWWGPHGYTAPRCEADAQPGGLIRIDMRAPDGTVYPMSGVFKEVIPPERLVFTSGALDENGNALFENLNIVTLEDVDGKTALTVRARAVTWTPQGVPYLAGMEIGWMQTIERVVAYAESTNSERTAQ